MLVSNATKAMQRLYRLTALTLGVICALLGAVSLPILGPTPNTLLCLGLSVPLVACYALLGRVDLDRLRQHAVRTIRAGFRRASQRRSQSL